MKNTFVLFLNVLFCCSIFFVSCSNDLDSSSENGSCYSTISAASQGIIRSLYATGGNGKVTLQWAPVSSDYEIYITQKKIHFYTVYNTVTKNSDPYYEVEQQDEPVKITAADINSSGTPCKTFSGLTNENEEENSSKTRYYSYTLSVYKNGTLVEEKTAEATAAGNFSFNATADTTACWGLLLSADSSIPEKADTNGVNIVYRSTSFQISKFLNSNNNSAFSNIYNNPSAVTELVQKSGFMETDDYKKYLNCLEDNEEIQWFTAFTSGYHIEVYGKIVNRQAEENGYNETSDYEVSTAEGSSGSITSLTDAFRIGTKIRTKGYYSEGDGGAALYVIANRNSTYKSNSREYTRKYSCLKTAAGQYCLLVPENNYINLLSLGAGKSFQVTWAKYADWRAYEAAYKKGTDSTEWASFKSSHSNWKSYIYNNDSERVCEAAGLLDTYRKKSNETITVFVPAGDYRAASGVAVVWQNFVLKGVNTGIRNPGPENTESFESSFTEASGEAGSSGTGRTVFYTDNGSSGTLDVVGPSNNVVIEGITWEAREIDSRRTYWHSTEKDSSGNYARDENGLFKDINYVGRGTCEKSMADEQWYSRQCTISQCSNVLFRNCEFIITRHVRDKDVWPSNLDAGNQNLYDFGGTEYLTTTVSSGICPGSGADTTITGYQANPYVEWCDLHTDKQFTSMSFYSGWHNVKVDNCLMYNMSAVFRGASMGFLDYYSEQCENGVLCNSVLYHNLHDEELGVFTLQSTNGAFKETESINGAYIQNNKIYILRDEHVDKIKPRVMASTIGYNDSRNIYNVRIEGNLYYADKLPSKIFTFGGNPSKGRDQVLIQNNTFEMVHSGGSYIAETCRSYVKFLNNTFNYHPDEGGSIGGTIIDARFPDDYEKYEIEFCGNTVNVDGNSAVSMFSTGGCKTNGKFNNNTINIKGNINGALLGSVWQCIPVMGARETNNNTINVGGKMTLFYYGNGEMGSDISVSGNKVTVNGNDYDDDYSVNSNSGGYRQTGNRGFTFVQGSFSTSNGKHRFIISNNTISAPNCTRNNKHLIRYTNHELPVIITENRLQKFQYLRSATSDDKSNLIFINNFDNYGNRMNLDSWIFKSPAEDTETGLYIYQPQTASYKLTKNFSVYDIPASYDDGNNGTHPVTVIGEAVYKNLAYQSACTFPATLVEIEKEAFCSSSSGFETLPAGLKIIREKAFYDAGSLGVKNGGAHYSVTQKLDYKFTIPSGVEIIESKAFRSTDRIITIYCEAPSKPAGWADDWYEQYQCGGLNTINVVWGSTGN